MKATGQMHHPFRTPGSVVTVLPMGKTPNKNPEFSVRPDCYGKVRLRVMTLMYSPLRPVGRGSLQAMRKPFGLASPTQ
jgi:hypothetical protein